MRPDQLARYGSALFGSCWAADLADALGVNARTVQRWANGRREIPPIEAELRELCEERAAALKTLATALATDSVGAEDGAQTPAK